MALSAYSSPPMEESGALSLGTTAGVGSNFAVDEEWERTDGTGLTVHQYGRFLNMYADGDYVYWASCFFGVHSYPISGGSYCDVLWNYSGSGQMFNFMDVTKSGNYFFAAQVRYGYASNEYAIYSFTSDDGDMTEVDSYNISNNSINCSQMYPDTTLPLIYMSSSQGIAVYCYNTSTGAIGHSDYDFSGDVGYGWDTDVYSYIRSGCKIVVMSRRPYGLSVWCMNTSNCTLGNYMCNVFKGGDNWLATTADIWGGCPTGCHLSDGGYFVVANRCGVGVVCTYNDSGTTKLCLESCFLVSSNFESGDVIYKVCGDDDHIYVSGRCSIVYQLSLNCSTGVLTKLNSLRYLDTIFPSDVPSLHTRQGYQIFTAICDSSYIAGFSIDKPVPHYSISGLYGGADDQDVSLSHYYKGGSYVANNSSNTNVPTSGAIDFSDFYSQG